MTREELIEALEKAIGPDRGLDADIYCLLHPEWGWDRSSQQPTGWVSTVSGSGITSPSPFYTRHIDAAVTLVPLGWSRTISVNENHRFPVVVMGRSYPTNAKITVEAHTEPLTICLAALKARAP